MSLLCFVCLHRAQKFMPDRWISLSALKNTGPLHKMLLGKPAYTHQNRFEFILQSGITDSLQSLHPDDRPVH